MAHNLTLRLAPRGAVSLAMTLHDTHTQPEISFGGPPSARDRAMSTPYIPGLLLDGEWAPPVRATGDSLVDIIEKAGSLLFPDHYLTTFDLPLLGDSEDPIRAGPSAGVEGPASVVPFIRRSQQGRGYGVFGVQDSVGKKPLVRHQRGRGTRRSDCRSGDDTNSGAGTQQPGPDGDHRRPSQ